MDNPANQWIAVTGASGFIGRNLLETLLADDRRVVAISRSRPDTAHFDRALSAGQARWVMKPEPDTNDLRDTGAIIMLAGLAHRSARRTPVAEYAEVNTNLSVRTAKAAIAAGCCRLVYVSTVAVHGDGPFSNPIDEATPIAPTTPYGSSKWQAEQALDGLCRESAVSLIRLRPPLVYAPNAPGSIAMLRKAIERRIPLPFASIKNSRSLIALEDLVAFLHRIVLAPDRKSSVVLVANAKPVTTPEIVNHIGKYWRMNPLLFDFSPKILEYLLVFAGLQRLKFQLLHDYLVRPEWNVMLPAWRPHHSPLIP